MMKIMQKGWYVILVFIVLTFYSCYKEYTYKDIVIWQHSCGNDKPYCDFGYVFDIQVTDDQQSNIYSTHSRITIENPEPIVLLNDESLMIDRLSVRGESSLNFRRKSFTLNLDQLLILTDSTGKVNGTFSRMKLLSMVFDYTYIESKIAYSFQEKLGLWPLFTGYAQLKINDSHEGLYLMVEDPEEYCLEKLHSGFIMRRGYHNAIDNYEYDPANTHRSLSDYQNMFRSIYRYIRDYSGQQLYDSLSAVMNVERYMMKLAIDYFLQNGDATDEVFFYADESDANSRLNVIPWDYDDIFSLLPHEINSDWATGTVFGPRYYASLDDIIADVGIKYIFSIEDDLDYKIAIDAFLYGKYLAVLAGAMEIITENVIHEICDEVVAQVEPYYHIDGVSSMSEYDVTQSNMESFLSNMDNKRTFLLNRRSVILDQLSGTY